MLADLSHGWAITVHRAQGSEFRGVIVVLRPEAARMLSRPLVYTALTWAVRTVGAKPRRTMLVTLLRGNQVIMGR